MTSPNVKIVRSDIIGAIMRMVAPSVRRVVIKTWRRRHLASLVPMESIWQTQGAVDAIFAPTVVMEMITTVASSVR